MINYTFIDTTFDGLDDILKKNLGIIENYQKKYRQSIIIHTIFHKNRGISKKRLNFAKSYIDNTEKLK